VHNISEQLRYASICLARSAVACERLDARS
jgi:hypothetical protein